MNLPCLFRQFAPALRVSLANPTSSFLGIRPAEAKCESAAIVFALIGVDGAALIEAEYFIVQVEDGGDKFEPAPDAVAPLEVDLRMRIRIVIPVRSPQAEIGARRVVILVNVGIVVRHASKRFILSET